MRTTPLFELLATAVAGAAGAACGLVEPCPHEVVDRQFDVAAEAAALCESLPAKWHEDLALSECRKLCRDDRITKCRYDRAYRSAFEALSEEARDASAAATCPLPPRVPDRVAIHCVESHTEGAYRSGCPIEGRRPAGFVSVARASDSLARYLTQCAELEAASIVAFDRLGAELAAHGAPEMLRARTRAAREDERRHARDVGALAQRYGAEVIEADVSDAREVRCLLAIALENVVEGVVRETFGAAVAIHKGAYARELSVKDVMASIAIEESRHAELAFALDEWFRARLTRGDNARLDQARAEAIAALRKEVGDLRIEPDLARAAGVPSPKTAHAMLDSLTQSLWRPRSRRPRRLTRRPGASDPWPPSPGGARRHSAKRA